MDTLLTQLTQTWNRLLPAFGVARQSDVPHQLMESAGARAGLDPQQARELRSAASAYLSVVR